MGDEPTIAVVVDDAKTEGFGPTKHTTFRISCSYRVGGGAASSTRHRFSDFAGLRKDLMESSPGVVVPPLPEKQVMNRFAPEFVEDRREMLEIFLQEIVSHPIVAASERIHSFLQWPEAMRSTVAQRVASFRLPSAPDAAAGDPLKDASNQVEAFEHQIAAIRERFKRLQHRQSEDGAEYQELSQNIKETSENPMNVVLAVALKPLIEGLHGLAAATKRQSQSTKKVLLPRLKLHKQLAVAMQEQFKRRRALEETIDKTNAKIKDLLAQSTKLAGKPGKEKKCSELEAQAAELQRRVRCPA